ncbi:glycerate kinase [Nitriliruptor alkaliphilus]|uniref:glycerate kinase family protein n=1 Tax=Nitriliruptor alkaliphilus TaxID=427918 RepID=UPI000697FA23|nr:glycerate kinase [Nitriliruptor alkaliphilus]
MKVVVAPDGFGGTLTAREAAAAIVAGWRRVRPGDDLVCVPMSDGGEGLVDVVATADDTWVTTEVAGPHGHPVDAAFLLRPDGSAVVESAQACGLHLVPADRRTPRLATTYGVGQLLDAARDVGATRLLVGLGGSASVDGGTGALNGLGLRLTVADGSGLKIGGEDLHRVHAVRWGWAGDWDGIEVVLLADVDARLDEAAPVFGPQKGATPEEIPALTETLRTWADVAERDLPGGVSRGDPGTGAAGGLGFGLGRALTGARFERGVDVVAELVGLDDVLADADLVVTGEGRLDATSFGTKVVGAVRDRARATKVPVAAVVGAVADGTAPGDLDVEQASPAGPGLEPAADVAAAAERLAHRAP